jgi:LPXTG-site transpeptidase (sortase) family protein
MKNKEKQTSGKLKSEKEKKPNYRKIYLLINIAVVGIIFLIISLMPLFPDAVWHASDFEIYTEGQSINNLLDFYSADHIEPLIHTDETSSHRVFIPKIKVDMYIVLNETDENVAFSQGAWHIPGSAEPNLDSGNVVIAAHRYLFTSGPQTFYHLDKVEVGDPVVVRWNHKDYLYHVTETKIVPPSAVEILRPTDEPTLTLFTCHPVFTTDKRLVVVAELSTTQ